MPKIDLQIFTYRISDTGSIGKDLIVSILFGKSHKTPVKGKESSTFSGYVVQQHTSHISATGSFGHCKWHGITLLPPILQTQGLIQN